MKISQTARTVFLASFFVLGIVACSAEAPTQTSASESIREAAPTPKTTNTPYAKADAFLEMLESTSVYERPVDEFGIYFITRCVREGDPRELCECGWTAFKSSFNGRDDKSARLAAYMGSSSHGTNLPPDYTQYLAESLQMMATGTEARMSACYGG